VKVYHIANLGGTLQYLEVEIARIEMENNLYDGYYFAGDFSELKVPEPFAYETMPWLLSHKGIYDKYKNDQVYWKAYYPIVSRLIAGMEQRKESGPECEYGPGLYVASAFNGILPGTKPCSIMTKLRSTSTISESITSM